MGVVDCAGGLITPTGTGPGAANIRVAVGQYPTLQPAEPFVLVVEAVGITADLYEPYSPTQPRVVDTRFEKIEGTDTWQDAVWQVLLNYSDGTSTDVTQHGATTIAANAPGTQTPDTSVLTFSQSPPRVTPAQVGLVDVVLSSYGFAQTVPGVEVTDDRTSIAALVPVLPTGGSTLSAIKDGASVEIQTWGVMGDGTRRRFHGARTIAGLLTYSSTAIGAATMDGGFATARGNASTIIEVDVLADQGADFDPPAELPVDVNLIPDVGDVDLGDTTGLAHKPRSVGEVFDVQARVNTGELALGAFDVSVSFDPAVLQPVSVTVGTDVQDAVFNTNTESQPGTVLFNGTLPISAGARKGPGIRIATIQFEVVGPGSTSTAISGSVAEMAALDGVQDIGPPTPRTLVSGDGVLTVP